jgi:hypothetical protein
MKIANIASYPARATSLRAVVNTVFTQVDRVNVVLNEFVGVPEFLRQFPNVTVTIPDEDVKDTGKFLPECAPDDLVLLMDDDIAYPDDYVAQSVSRWEALGNRRVVAGYHGSVYHRPSPAFLARKGIDLFTYQSRIAEHREVHAFSQSLKEAMRVEQLGTGTVLALGSQLPPMAFMAGSERFVDVRLARWCHDRDIPMVALPRQKNWLRQIPTSESIFKSFTRTHPPYVATEILSLLQTKTSESARRSA